MAMKEKPIVPTWGYSRNGATLFEDFREGDELPPGYYDSPAKVPTVGRPKKVRDEQ